MSGPPSQGRPSHTPQARRERRRLERVAKYDRSIPSQGLTVDSRYSSVDTVLVQRALNGDAQAYQDMNRGERNYAWRVLWLRIRDSYKGHKPGWMEPNLYLYSLAMGVDYQTARKAYNQWTVRYADN